MLAALAAAAPAQVSACLPTIVPLVSERMVDAREQVTRGSIVLSQPQQQVHDTYHGAANAMEAAVDESHMQ
jgi:hypothetical protein